MRLDYKNSWFSHPKKKKKKKRRRRRRRRKIIENHEGRKEEYMGNVWEYST